MHVLDDILVIDLTQALAGPYCAMLPGDVGAEVIKIVDDRGIESLKVLEVNP